MKGEEINTVQSYLWFLLTHQTIDICVNGTDMSKSIEQSLQGVGREDGRDECQKKSVPSTISLTVLQK